MVGERFNPDKAAKLLNPERAKMLPPQKFIDLLDIQEADNIADLGTGNGYFAIPFAKATQQTVYGVDVEPKMIKALKARVEEQNISNVEFLLSDLESINLPHGCVEKVFVAFVLHEVPKLSKAISEIKRILKPNGRVVVVEWKKDAEGTMGPPNHERIPSAELASAFEAQGFQVSITHPNPNIYALIIENQEE